MSMIIELVNFSDDSDDSNKNYSDKEIKSKVNEILIKPDIFDDAVDELEKPKSKKSEALKRAQKKYREKNREKYCESQRLLYNKLKENKEWKEKFNSRAKIPNSKYREKKKEEKLADPNYIPKKRGRPIKL
jgi:hypothetical protein